MSNAERGGMRRRRMSVWLCGALGVAASAVALTAITVAPAIGAKASAAPTLSDAALEEACRPEAAQGVASGLPGAKVTVQSVPNGPFKTATRFVRATGAAPAYCQVSGSFVTNPKTGKTANFVATFPAAWNRKYLQLGCSGHCGQFYVSDPATPAIVVTAQGHPGQIIQKGYASFATDEGHVGMSPAGWALRKDGSVDQDALDDFYYRADRVLADVGKAFTTAFYAQATKAPQKISYAYFEGCSGGGRDAMVAASYFPEAFDGIIAGSPYDMLGMGIHTAGVDVGIARSPGNAVTPELMAEMDRIVKARCDAADGVKDGIIQNPLACNFRPDRDLPRCADDKPGAHCFTKGQIETISTMVSAVTDEHGRVISPGYSISELQAGAGVGSLGADVQKVFTHKNDPNYSVAAQYAFKAGGPGQIAAFHTVFPAAEVARIKAEIAPGEGHLQENTGRLMSSKTKMLLWHNFSDERLTPVSTINWYKQLAKSYGGYARVQNHARLFLIPGTAHCSITGIAPNAFDALTTMENWVEKGRAPESIHMTVANHQFSPGAPPAPALEHPDWTATVCKFPEMARYSGKGDVKDAANWSCSPKDTRMLKVGETGRQAGAIN